MKKLEMKMSREEAIQAQNQKVKENRIIVKHEKEKLIIEEIRLEENRMKDLKHKNELVIKVEEGKQNAEKQIRLMKDKKKQIHDELEKEMLEANKKRKEDVKIELEKKKELIKELKELNVKPIDKLNGYDPSECSGFGFLDEMSLVELQKKLVDVKEAKIREAEDIKIKAIKDKEE